jgi:hypothetical protein
MSVLDPVAASVPDGCSDFFLHINHSAVNDDDAFWQYRMIQYRPTQISSE